MQNGPPDSPRSCRGQGTNSDNSVKTSTVPDSQGATFSDDRGLHHGPLPTLHEDSEFSYLPAETNKIPLTQKAMMATIEDRMNVEIRPIGGPYLGYVACN